MNATYKKHIRAVPRELFAVERLHLKPLPAWIPEVYRLDIELDPRHLVTHIRTVAPMQRITLAEHKPPRGERVKLIEKHPEE